MLIHCYKAENAMCSAAAVCSRLEGSTFTEVYGKSRKRAQIRLDQQVGLQYDPTLKVQFLQGI